MDCLHGILMHGDSNQGDSHKDEDTYIRFKSELEAGKPKAKAGPLDAEEMFHGDLMHGGGEAHHDGDKEALPRKPAEKFGPEDAETMLHGVLMHGDSEQGHDHRREDTNSKAGAKIGKAGPLDAEQMMHGVLMHGDSDSHHDHTSSEKQTTESAGPVDLNDMMHSLMHADGSTEHQHVEADDKSKGKPGPMDQENLMHNLMHGEEGTEHKHEKENKPFKFNIDEILKLDIPEDILKSVGLDKVKKMDENEYQEWKTKQNDENKDFWGETMAFISDTILRDIDLMKKRYLARDEKLEKEIDDYAAKKDGDFSAKDIVENLNLEGQDHDGDDLRHDLELVGSTEPINARHKAHMEMKNSKEKA